MMMVLCLRMVQKLDTIEEAEKHKVITKLYMRLVENRNANFAYGALFLSSK